MSLPTLLFLNRHDFWVAGSLHGQSYLALRQWADCDLKVIGELRHLVNGLQQEYGLTPAAIRFESWPELLADIEQTSKHGSREESPPAPPCPVQSKWPDHFTVPENARSWDPLGLPLSARTQALLRNQGIRRLGELHDLPCEELPRRWLCDLGSIVGLHRLLQKVQAGEVTPVPCNFEVPENIRDWKISELPLSARLEHVLGGLGITRVGELQRISFWDLKRAHNCGIKTFTELQRVLERAAAGEFDPPQQRAGWQPKTLIQILERLVGFLTDQQQQILCDRLGAESGEVELLEDIAQRAHLTRERIRQVVLVCLIHIRKSGSLPLKFHLERLKARCNLARCALSPDVLGRWLAADSARHRFALPFYVRLIARLEPSIKVEGI